MESKIIQIETHMFDNSKQGELDLNNLVTVLYALCEDGTVWQKIHGDGYKNNDWERIDNKINKLKKKKKREI